MTTACNGSVITFAPALAGTITLTTGQITIPPDLGTAGLRLSKIYQAGIQFNLPLKNRIAEADAARDLLQVRQAEARTQLLSNQVREQVQNALIALQTARSALNAATQSRIYQEQLVSAESLGEWIRGAGVVPKGIAVVVDEEWLPAFTRLRRGVHPGAAESRC